MFYHLNYFKEKISLIPAPTNNVTNFFILLGSELWSITEHSVCLMVYLVDNELVNTVPSSAVDELVSE